MGTNLRGEVNSLTELRKPLFTGNRKVFSFSIGKLAIGIHRIALLGS